MMEQIQKTRDRRIVLLAIISNDNVDSFSWRNKNKMLIRQDLKTWISPNYIKTKIQQKFKITLEECCSFAYKPSIYKNDNKNK